MAAETRSYGNDAFSLYGYETSSSHGDSSGDSGVSDLEDSSEVALDVLERHGKYWDSQSIEGWNIQSVNYGRFIISDKSTRFVTGNFGIRAESLDFDYSDCRQVVTERLSTLRLRMTTFAFALPERRFHRISLKSSLSTAVAGLFNETSADQNGISSLHAEAIVDIQFGGLIASPAKPHDDPPANETLAKLRTERVHAEMIQMVKRMMEEAGLVSRGTSSFSVPPTSTVARAFQTGDLWRTPRARKGLYGYLSTWANLQPEAGVEMLL
ncbi:hypothetical protein BDP55DRAFT_637771 [Colletotrichum godetiae]|uniref:Uncharacterized protein n=1 Tax=Colletotrichum godetiae TaxID=1209918 RepID=A0AAJ0ENG1_9PEZI|nr:uncharacterized protein BDP55DRAFT_637771 [Colletotrichum godetiae]KAK1658546.1 hypothetical protein BDP55DRAFT_637771 [Colletotrichum godetiae]